MEKTTRTNHHANIVQAQGSTEAAAPAKKTTKRSMLCFVLFVLLGFSLGCSEFVVIGIEPELAENYRCSIARIGELISLFALAYAIATPLLSIFTGSFRRSTILVVYLAIFVVSNFVSATAPTYEVLLISRIVMGAVSGPLLAVATTYVPDLLGAHRSSIGISIIYAAFSIALVLATSAGRFKEPPIIFGVLLFTFGVGAVYTFYGYVAPYLETYLGFPPAQSGLILLVFGIICIVSDLISGVVDVRAGMKPIPAMLFALALALFALWLCKTNSALALVPIFLIALLMYSFSISCITMFMGVARKRHPRALVLAASIEPTSFNIGIAFGTLVGGLVVTHAGLGEVGLVGGILGVLSCICAAIARRFWQRMQDSSPDRS